MLKVLMILSAIGFAVLPNRGVIFGASASTTYHPVMNSPMHFMSANKDIVENVSNDAELSTLSTALKTAKLNTALKGEGPFTLFAASDRAFASLPNNQTNKILTAADQGPLNKVLTYEIVKGVWDTTAILKGIQENGGRVMMKTASGGSLFASLRGNEIIIVDEKGNTASLSRSNLPQKNGVVHVINHVLFPQNFTN